jgi:hypothetical protein
MVKMSDENVELPPACGDSESTSTAVDSACMITDVDVVTAGGDSDSGGSLSSSASPAPPGATALPEDWNGVEQSDADSGVVNGSTPVDCESSGIGFEPSSVGDGGYLVAPNFTQPNALPVSASTGDSACNDIASSATDTPVAAAVTNGSPTAQSAPLVSGAVHDNCNGSSGVTGANGSTPVAGASGSGNQQYVVNVHVNAGETFSVRVGDRVQLIHGKQCYRIKFVLPSAISKITS